MTKLHQQIAKYLGVPTNWIKSVGVWDKVYFVQFSGQSVSKRPTFVSKKMCDRMAYLVIGNTDGDLAVKDTLSGRCYVARCHFTTSVTIKEVTEISLSRKIKSGFVDFSDFRSFEVISQVTSLQKDAIKPTRVRDLIARCFNSRDFYVPSNSQLA